MPMKVMYTAQLHKSSSSLWICSLNTCFGSVGFVYTGTAYLVPWPEQLQMPSSAQPSCAGVICAAAGYPQHPSRCTMCPHSTMPLWSSRGELHPVCTWTGVACADPCCCR
jgi:hypothetical protein